MTTTDLKTQLQAELPELPESFDVYFEQMLQKSAAVRALAATLGIEVFSYAEEAPTT